MKKIILFFSIVITLTSFALTSCNRTEDIVVKSVKEQPDIELAKLYNSIDSLHNEYSILPSTRGAKLNKWGKRLLCGIADACVGGITSGLGPGSLVCSIVASGLYEDYLNYCTKKIKKSPFAQIDRNVSSVQKAVVFTKVNSNFVDSIGYYHNTILDEVRSTGKSFVNANGSINYAVYYNEVLAASKRIGISTKFTINKTLIFRYLDSIIKPLAQVEDISEETVLSIIFNGTYNNFNFDDTKTLQLRNICEKIIYNDLCVDEGQEVEYGTKVNELIVKSNVANDTKETMKVANNIAINSLLYWRAN